MAYLITSLNPTKALAVDEVNGTTTYIGMAKAGTAAGDSKWQIRRITKTGTVTIFEFADGNDRYDNEWDNRATTVVYS
jgi:hypothetical protein